MISHGKAYTGKSCIRKPWAGYGFRRGAGWGHQRDNLTLLRRLGRDGPLDVIDDTISGERHRGKMRHEGKGPRPRGRGREVVNVPRRTRVGWEGFEKATKAARTQGRADEGRAETECELKGVRGDVSSRVPTRPVLTAASIPNQRSSSNLPVSLELRTGPSAFPAVLVSFCISSVVGILSGLSRLLRSCSGRLPVFNSL